MNQLPHQALWNAFQDGFRFQAERGVFEMDVCDVGRLMLPSGRVVAADPLLDPWREPFSFRVRPGAYPVQVALAWDDVALVRVLFRKTAPIRWKTAEPDCFGVDSATGCLLDHRLSRYLRRKATANNYQPYWERFNDHKERGDLWESVELDGASGANVFVFHTWGGDGRFPSFYGFDAKGKLVCLVTDMLLHRAVFDGWLTDPTGS